MRPRWVIGAAVAIAVGIVVIAALGTRGARAAGVFGGPGQVTCAFDPSARALRIDYGIPGRGRDQAPIVWISRVGEAIRIEEDFPGPGPNVRCAGGRPSVSNTDRVELAAVTRLRTSETYMSIGSRGLAPGATPEPGGDEIEVNSNLGPSAHIHVNGGRGPDRWTFGSRRGDRYLVNFNPRESHPDGDLDIAVAPRSLSANLGGGSNRVTALGGSGTGSALSIGVLLIGDDGSDRFVGGPGDDELLGYGANDVLVGGAGDDRLDIVGGKGHDRLICGPGRDEYRSSAKDRVRCSGSDEGRGAGRT